MKSIFSLKFDSAFSGLFSGIKIIILLFLFSILFINILSFISADCGFIFYYECTSLYERMEEMVFYTELIPEFIIYEYFVEEPLISWLAILAVILSSTITGYLRGKFK